MNVISKLRIAKKLIDPYCSNIGKDPKKRVEDDVDCEKTLESNKEPNTSSPNRKDYIPHVPLPSALKSTKEKPNDPYLP